MANRYHLPYWQVRLRALHTSPALQKMRIEKLAFNFHQLLCSTLTTGDWDIALVAVEQLVWGRWFVFLVTMFQFPYRPEFWYPDNVEYTLPPATMLALDGQVHYPLLTNGPVTRRWMFALSAMDIVLITADIVIGGGFKCFTLQAYYPTLVISAAVFTSLRLGLTWTTKAAVAFAIVSLGAGSGGGRPGHGCRSSATA